MSSDQSLSSRCEWLPSHVDATVHQIGETVYASNGVIDDAIEIVHEHAIQRIIDENDLNLACAASILVASVDAGRKIAPRVIGRVIYREPREFSSWYEEIREAMGNPLPVVSKKMSLARKIVSRRVHKKQERQDEDGTGHVNTKKNDRRDVPPKTVVFVDFENIFRCHKAYCGTFSYWGIVEAIYKSLQENIWGKTYHGWMFCTKHLEPWAPDKVSYKASNISRHMTWHVHERIVGKMADGAPFYEDIDKVMRKTMNEVVAAHGDDIEECIVVSGDKHFVPILRLADQLKMRTRVIAVRGGLSRRLAAMAYTTHYIDFA